MSNKTDDNNNCHDEKVDTQNVEKKAVLRRKRTEKIIIQGRRRAHFIKYTIIGYFFIIYCLLNTTGHYFL